MNSEKNKGFTLIEVLLVIAILAILASIAIFAINPAKQIGEAQNAQRRADVQTIADAIVQYSIDNEGSLPSGIPVGTTCIDDGVDICEVDTLCTGGASLDVLVSGKEYLSDLPTDPTASTASITGYAVMQDSNGRASVCAQTTYDNASISVTR